MDVERGPGTARDPVCGMTVDRSTKHSCEHEGKIYYFCCAGCLAKFKGDPGKYLKPAGAGLVTIGAIASCHGSTPAEDENEDDGESPARVPLAAVAGDSAYVCPMCPEVRQSGPGPCPKCGMALERETAGYRGTRGIYLPHASGDGADGAGDLPHLRHGAGAADGDGGGGRES